MTGLLAMGRNGWTGGQYSLYRVAFGVWIAGATLQHVGDNPWLWLAVALSLPFIAGIGDRWAALLLAADLVLPQLRWSMAPWPVLLAPLVLHALLPRAPYGALAGRGRVDPAGGWRQPPLVTLAAWCLAAVAAGWAVADLLGNRSAFYWIWSGVAMGLLGMVALRRRALAWLLMLGLAGYLCTQYGYGTGVLWLVLFCFDPAWIRPGGEAALLFYDGSCGLCHRTVRFLLAEDHEPRIRYSTIGSPAFESAVQHDGPLPDSLVLHVEGQPPRFRSQAALGCMVRLGGVWRLLAGAMAVIPPAFRDWCYDRVAAVRHRLFPQPEGACPLMPPTLRERFVDLVGIRKDAPVESSAP